MAVVCIFILRRSAIRPAFLEDNAAAMELGTKFNSRIASCTLALVASLTPEYPFTTLDTVEIATPACFATSLMETIFHSYPFPLYGKRFRKTKKFAAHDEKESAKVGDIVKITSTRPYSKTKTFRLEQIKEHAKEGN